MMKILQMTLGDQGVRAKALLDNMRWWAELSSRRATASSCSANVDFLLSGLAIGRGSPRGWGMVDVA